MREITKTYTIYNIDDIKQNEDLKQIILEKHSDINVDYEWYADILEDWQEKLTNYGFINSDISFNGFYSQGDGASFTCKNIDIIQFLKQSLNFTGKEEKILKALFNNDYINFTIKRIDWHYYHKYTVRLISDINTQDRHKRINTIINKLSNNIIIDMRLLMASIYDDLQKQYEYLTSEQVIFETLEANDYEFYSDGSIAA